MFMAFLIATVIAGGQPAAAARFIDHQHYATLLACQKQLPIDAKIVAAKLLWRLRSIKPPPQIQVDASCIKPGITI